MRTALVQPDRRLPTSEPRTAPPPVGGLNARDSVLDMPPTDARVLTNAIPRPGEVEIRKGAGDWVTEIPDSVETLMSYVPPSGSPLLFAATETEIYDVSASGTVGTATNLELDPGPPAVYEVFTSGRWQYVNFANSFDNWLICVNGSDDMRVFDGTDWTTTATFTGTPNLDTDTLVDVCIYQKRLFFLQKDSRLVHYLDTGAISGAYYTLQFEQLISRGGWIQAIGTWSVDAGDGLDDLFVAVTSEGEAIVYAGIDPSDISTWALRGVYFVGRPLGQRCLFKMASELYVITERGIYPMSRALTEGTLLPDSYLSAKVNNIFQQYSTETTREFLGWEAAVSSADNLLLVNIPLKGDYFNQLVLELTTKGWALIKGWNANCWHFFNGNLYFGYVTPDGEGRVAKAFTGHLDFPLTGDENNGTFIKAYISPAYSSFSKGPPHKHIKLFRPMFLSGTKFQYRVGVSSDVGTPFPLTTVIGELPGGTSLWGSTTTPVIGPATWSTTYVWNGLTNVTKWWHSVDSWPGAYVSLYLEIENTGKSPVKLLGIDYLLGNGSIL